MSRKAWIWLVVALTALALAATFVIVPRLPAPVADTGPPATPFGWQAQLSLTAGDGVRGVREGVGLQARFDDPWGIVVAEDGTRYVADAGDSNRIRRIGADGTVTTLAGGREGFADGAGPTAAFDTPSALAHDAEGNLYVADTGNHAIRKVTPQGVVTTLAGTGWGEYYIRAAAAHEICARVRLAGHSIARASEGVINRDIPKAGGDGGAIALGADGSLAFPFNTEGMYRGWIGSDGVPHVAIYKEDALPAR